MEWLSSGSALLDYASGDHRLAQFAKPLQISPALQRATRRVLTVYIISQLYTLYPPIYMRSTFDLGATLSLSLSLSLSLIQL